MVRMFTGVATLTLTVVLALVVVSAAGTDRRPMAISARPAGSPVGVVQRYLAALAAHDAGGVCATFSPQLQTYIGQWDTGPDCRSRVSRSHWSSGNLGERSDIRIIHVGRVDLDHYQDVAVNLIVWFDYRCIGDMGPIPGCRPGFQNRPNVIYLRHIDHRWLIVKPGHIYDDTDTTAPPAWYDPTTPPGDSAMVRRLARPPGAIPSCPRPGVAVAGRSRSLLSDDGRRHVPFAEAPWLHIRHVDVARVGRQFCVALLLGARPRVDSLYALEIDQADAGGALSDSFNLSIDATGNVHAQLTESATGRSTRASSCRTSYGIAGDTLEMVITAQSFAPDRAVIADASSASLQPGEPLLRHPLSANDTAPAYPGVRVAPGKRPASSCDGESELSGTRDP